MAGIKFSDFPVISAGNINDDDRVLSLHKNGTIFQNSAFTIGDLKTTFRQVISNICISGSGQNVIFGQITGSSLQISGSNIIQQIADLQAFSSSLDNTFASDYEVSILSSSIEIRLIAQENFSSSLNNTFATDAELSFVSSSIASDLNDLDASVSNLSSSFATDLNGLNVSVFNVSSSIESRLTNQENFSSSLNNTFATDSELSSVSSSLASNIISISSSLTITDNYLQSQITSVSNSLATLDVTSASYASTASYIQYNNIDGIPPLSSTASLVYDDSTLGTTNVKTALEFLSSSIQAVSSSLASLNVDTASLSFTASYVEYTSIGNKPTLISGSSQIASDISGSFFSISSSISSEINSLQAFSSSIDNIYISSSGQNVVLGQISASNIIVSGNVEIDGTLIANELFISELTRSIIYASGSSRFGDTDDDIHSFTGSVKIKGGLTGSMALFDYISSNDLTTSGSIFVSGSVLIGNGFVGISENFVLTNQTTDNTPTTLFKDGSGQRLILTDNSSVMFNAIIVGSNVVSQELSSYQLTGVADRGVGAASIRLANSIKTIYHEDILSWDGDVSVSIANGSLDFNVIGENGKTINWIAKVELIKI
jgi:hypothetical protein